MATLATQGLLGTVQWEEAATRFPCPEIMWQGVWKKVGEEYGQSWDVWAAVLSAIGATAARKIDWYYVKAPLYGMTYQLIVAPTGSGKELCGNICAALLPTDYNMRDAVQSGPALFPIMADSMAKGVVRVAKPTILVISEWTKLAGNAQIQHSSLIEDLNTLFHRARPWNVSRSERDLAGGDKQLIEPALSVFGTTTPEKLRETVTEGMMNDGFLNRYLLLPGPTLQWEFWPTRKQAGAPAKMLAGLQRELALQGKTEVWGNGASYQEAFRPEAAQRLQVWGAPYFEPMMKSSSMQANRKKRLHMYAHLISMLAAWSAGRRMVELDDVEMAICAVETSSLFVDWLFADAPIQLSRTEIGDFQTEELLYDVIKRKPNYYDDAKLYANYHKSRKLSAIKIQRAARSLMAVGRIFVDPDSYRYVTKEDAFPKGTVEERGTFVLRDDA